MSSKSPVPHKIAIIHDWLHTFRGGERCLEALCELYPTAEIFTLLYSKGKVGKTIEAHPIHTSFLNRLPNNRKYYRYLLPLFPLAVERFDLSSFDLVISSSHCVAKGAIVNPSALHVCYCYTPMRYAWDRYQDYFGKKWFEPLIFPFIHYLRQWDTQSSARVDHFIGISKWVQNRIKKYYRRESDIVHPFVDLENYTPKAKTRHTDDYYLVVSAFAPYKRLDLAIKACNQLGKKLWIVGEGQEKAQLQSLAGENTRFLGRISDEKLLDVYSNAKALLFPGEEDFGITPLEAMACGTPVIAFYRGGAMDTIIDGKTGMFFREQTVESLCNSIVEFEKRSQSFQAEVCRKQAEQFTKEKFKRGICRIINQLYEDRYSKDTAESFSTSETSPAQE